MTPSWVVSSNDTVGMLSAEGKRARQLDLFWSSNVYNTLTIRQLEEANREWQAVLASHEPSRYVRHAVCIGVGRRARGSLLHNTRRAIRRRRHGRRGG